MKGESELATEVTGMFVAGMFVAGIFVGGLIVEGEKVEGIIVVEKFVAELTHTFPFTEIVPLGHGVHEVA